MKNLLYFLAVITMLFSCKNNAQNTIKNDFISIGKPITAENYLNKIEIGEKYKALKIGDTLTVKFKSTIEDVCQNKGCWIKLNIANREQAFVKFKDYAFFMPKDSKGQEIIVNGKAFLSEVSIDEQKHYAEDKGESKAVIDAIVTPKLTYSFTAEGVLLKEKK